MLFLVAFVLAIWITDSYQTRYLNLSESVAQNSFLLTNVQILPMNRDTVLSNHAVRIENGIITAVGEQVSDNGLSVIDGKGSYLLPGLTDMHVHVWDKYELGLYLANGVTAVRNLWGQPMHLRLKKALNAGELAGPLFFSSGPKLTGPEFIGDDNTQLNSISESQDAVDAAKKAGYDLIKTYYNLPADYFEAIRQRAGKLKMDIAAHPTPNVPYTAHFTEGIVTVEHAEDVVQQPLRFNLDSVKLDSVVRAIGGGKGTSFTPTLTVFHNIYEMLDNPDILNAPQMDFMNPMIRRVDSKAQVDRWVGSLSRDSTLATRILEQHKFHLKIVEAFHRSGINLVCGTDAGIGITVPGNALHQELQFYKEAGLTNFEVLQTATFNASKTHEFLSDTGSIQVGKIANLVLLSKNPMEQLESLKNPDYVFVRGRVFSSEKLAYFREKGRDRPNLLMSFLRYAEYLLSK
jgi:imidazolonepropionase-like amidohydrolase